MTKKTTIQDIADALGVSRNTVSKAINNSPGLAEATREIILRKAVEMGYKQFSYVQALYQSGSAPEQSCEPSRGAPAQELSPDASAREIALLTPVYFSASHFASLMLDRLRQELLRLGCRLNTYHVSAEELRERRLPFAFQPEQVSAIICIEMFDWDYDRMLCELGLPLLFVDGPPRVGGRSLPADQLYMDNSTELSRLLSDLLRRGVRRIGFLGDYLHCQSFFERYMTFRMAMTLEGVPVEERFILPANSTPELYRGLEALEELPELFVCANDFVAYDALQILRRLDKRVPEDLMLCGFDDAPESRMVVPALTTVHIHTQAMAFSAAQLLLTRIREPSLDFRKVYTDTDLVLRESTGALRDISDH